MSGVTATAAAAAAAAMPGGGPVLVPAQDLVFASPGDFDANFKLTTAASYAASAAELAFIDCVNGCVAAIAGARLLKRASDGPELLKEAQTARDNGIRRLRAQADAVAALPPGAARDAEASKRMAECWRTEGRFTEFLRQLDTTPFIVEAKPHPEDAKLSWDVKIRVRDAPISDDRGRLKSELDRAVTVTRAVLTERERAVGWIDWVLGRHAMRIATARQRLSEYIEQLSGIATVGLMNLDVSQAVFARLDLARFKAEFTVREAGMVKNRYVRRLGWACAIMALLTTVAYVTVRMNEQWTVIHAFRNFWLLAVGTSIGTWLSFSLRRVVLTFDDLAVLEEDRLDPFLRVLFMVGLVLVVGLLFWTGAISFGIGPLGSQEAMQVHGAWALLMGLLAGIAERALGTAISRRASDFAVSVGGGSPTASSPSNRS